MNKTCTSLEQSKKLIELGIDVKTADMYYSSIPVREWKNKNDTSQGIHLVFKEKVFAIENTNDEIGEGDILAWSLSALMNLLDDKAGLAKEYGLWFCYDNGKSHCTKHCETQIDAAFEMVCWLLENKKI